MILAIFLLPLFRITMISEKVANKKYHCIDCNYTTSKKSDYDKHILTAKHKRITMKVKKSPKNLPEMLTCECGKQYKHLSGLSRHKKQCVFVIEENKEVKEDKKEEEINVIKSEGNN